MPSCVFRKCTNYDRKINKDKGISYHRFPSNEVNRQDWINIVRKQRSEYDWMPSNSSRICSNHFKNEDKYTSTKGLTLLKDDVVPSLEEQNVYKHDTHSISSLVEVIILDEEENFETPTEIALRKTICQLKLDKYRLQYKNKLLCQQNKRLRNKISKTMTILKILKRQKFISKKPSV